MRVRDKYAQEIIDIALNGETVTFDDNGKPVPCSHYVDCYGCRFASIYDDCAVHVKDYANSEYKEPILTDSEREFLGFLVNHIKPKIDAFRLYSCGSESRYLVFRPINEKYERYYFPQFTEGTMYKGMEVDRWYTPEELGL